MPEIATEYERKFTFTEGVASNLVRSSERCADIAQSYLSASDASHELRVRQTQPVGEEGAEHTAAVKIGEPPARREIETPISEETYRYWLEHAYAEAIKRRYWLASDVGALTLDHYYDQAIWLAEIEGDVADTDPEAIGLGGGIEVTKDKVYKGRSLAIDREREDDEAAEPLMALCMDDAIEHLVEAQRTFERPIVIAIAGGTGSGKTTLTLKLAERFGLNARPICMDDYYHGKTKLRQINGDVSPNFDEPLAFDLQQLADDLHRLKSGNVIQMPQYDVLTWDPHPEKVEHPGCTDQDVIILEGLYALHPELLHLVDVGIYVDSPLATRIGRRLTRDVVERPAITPEDNLRLCLEVAELSFAEHGLSQKDSAHILVRT